MHINKEEIIMDGYLAFTIFAILFVLGFLVGCLTGIQCIRVDGITLRKRKGICRDHGYQPAEDTKDEGCHEPDPAGDIDGGSCPSLKERMLDREGSQSWVDFNCSADDKETSGYISESRKRQNGSYKYANHK